MLSSCLAVLGERFGDLKMKTPPVALFPGGIPKPTAEGFQGVSPLSERPMQLDFGERATSFGRSIFVRRRCPTYWALKSPAPSEFAPAGKRFERKLGVCARPRVQRPDIGAAVTADRANETLFQLG